MGLRTRLANNLVPGSVANQFRQKRFALFRALIEQLPKPIRVLDVGGTHMFWNHMEFTPDRDTSITLLNVDHPGDRDPRFHYVDGDGRDLRRYADASFDVVFSNSVIEHLGDYTNQQRMAREITRVGKRYFVQTPNRYFLIEPHFLLPLFQFLPVAWRASIVSRFNISWYGRLSPPDARRLVEEIRLITRSELSRLFPDAELYRERVMGLTKSFIAYGG
jgi:Methyltransferase domain